MRPRLLRRSLVDAAPALLVACLAALPLARALARASWASLGRDQGIFQYTAWAVDRGEALYRDVRDVNGPVITMVHLAFLRLGGADELCFRRLDLIVSGLVFAFAGACLPSIARARPSVAYRAAWALGAWAALSAEYVVYGFWDTAQRESFLAWFVLVSVALGATHAARADPRTRRSAWTLAGAGAASFMPWFGKPTFALFTASQLAAMAFEEEPVGDRVRRIAIFLAGGVAGAAVPLAFVAVFGDLRAWARISFVDVPTMYRFVWWRSALEIFALPGYAKVVAFALATTVGLVALVARGGLPRRALPIATMPALGLVSVVAQAKGFPYHFHPVTLGLSFGWLAALAVGWERMRSRRARGAVLIAAAVLGGRAALLSLDARYPPVPPSVTRGGASNEGAVVLDAFERSDFFPRALQDAAGYVAVHTRADDRVQMYGMDPYVLFLARRLSATPYVLAYDLNADAALAGSLEPGGARPSAAQAERIHAMQRAHARDLFDRLDASPPAAFVFVDRSPLLTHASAFADFAAHCPDAATFVLERYREEARFGVVGVWMRRDRALDSRGSVDAVELAP